MTLEKMLARHGEDYFIHHWTWATKSSVTARQAARRLKMHMDELLRAADKEGLAMEGLLNMGRMAQRFIGDLWQLTPADYEKLCRLDDEELMTQFPIDTTGLQPWLAEELKKHGGNLRLKEGE